jgi:hypothetical protein
VRRSSKVLCVLALAVGLGAAAVVPATAADRSTAVSAQQLLSYCNPLASPSSQLFSSYGRLTPAILGRGGDLREPELGQVIGDLPVAAKGKARNGFRATVPVYFHVITDGATGNVSGKAIADQIRVMNLAFGGFYGGVDSGFTFDLAGVTRTDNAAWFYAGPSTSAEREMKRALHQGGANALNLYSATAGAFLGWAYLPSIVDQNGHSYLDGIVFDWESMVGTSTTYAGRYDLGFTAVHEAGHWLNLEHTFYGGCNAHGDYVDDTPAELTPTSGCPADGTKDTCSDPGFDPIHNYMDYSYDECYYEFTAGQVQRERDAWLFYRAGAQ